MISIIKKLLHNKILFFLFLLFIIVNIVDIITASFILEGESNPLFLITNNFWILLAFKIIILYAIGAYIYRNVYPTHFSFYMIVLVIVLGTLTVGIASYTNIQGIKAIYKNPELLKDLQNISKEEKHKSFWNFAIIIYYIPIIMCLITFWIYDKTQKYIIIDKNYFKQKPWWKRW